MPIVAVIPQEKYDFSTEPKTDLPVIRVFGHEQIVNPLSAIDDIETYVNGVSCLLDTDLRTLAERHPDAWVSNNPMLGEWRPVDPERVRILREIYAENKRRQYRDDNVKLSLELYHSQEKEDREKSYLLRTMERIPRNWREKKASRTLA